MKLSVVTNEDYGTFIDKQGDTLKTTPVVLENISYGDAQAGLIQFAAVKKNPDSVEVCRIRAELESDPSKEGEKDVPVLEQTLKIVMTAPYEVQPVIPPTVVNTPRAENRKEFTVRLTRGGEPVVNHPFQLTTDYVDGSCGHDHVAPRRAENRQNYGHFILRRTNEHHDRPYDGQTQANGREEFDYVASIFGDRMKIRVDSRKNPLLWDTLSVAEKVPGLVLLPDGADYAKVGGTCNHHGPTDQLPANSPCQTPDNNHWADSTVVRNLEQIARAWNEEFPNELILQINDISLPCGGKFDVGGRWVGPHDTHRAGKDVDVRTELPGARQGIPVRVPRNSANWRTTRLIRNRRFEQICRPFGVDPNIHLENTDQEHYHLDF